MPPNSPPTNSGSLEGRVAALEQANCSLLEELVRLHNMLRSGQRGGVDERQEELRSVRSQVQRMEDELRGLSSQVQQAAVERQSVEEASRQLQLSMEVSVALTVVLLVCLVVCWPGELSSGAVSPSHLCVQGVDARIAAALAGLATWKGSSQSRLEHVEGDMRAQWQGVREAMGDLKQDMEQAGENLREVKKEGGERAAAMASSLKVLCSRMDAADSRRQHMVGMSGVARATMDTTYAVLCVTIITGIVIDVTRSNSPACRPARAWSVLHTVAWSPLWPGPNCGAALTLCRTQYCMECKKNSVACSPRRRRGRRSPPTGGYCLHCLLVSEWAGGVGLVCCGRCVEVGRSGGC